MDNIERVAERCRTSNDSYAAIGREFGLSRSRVQQICGPLDERGSLREVKVYARPTTPRRVREVAEGLGIVTPQARGGSIGALLDAIADGRVVVRPTG